MHDKPRDRLEGGNGRGGRIAVGRVSRFQSSLSIPSVYIYRRCPTFKKPSLLPCRVKAHQTKPFNPSHHIEPTVWNKKEGDNFHNPAIPKPFTSTRCVSYCPNQIYCLFKVTGETSNGSTTNTHTYPCHFSTRSTVPLGYNFCTRTRYLKLDALTGQC